MGVTSSNSENGLNIRCFATPSQTRFGNIKILGAVRLLSRKRVCSNLFSLSKMETFSLFRERVPIDLLDTMKSKLMICL